MSRKLLSRFLGFLSSRNMVGVDKHGNRYFTRNEEVDGIMKEKRWVIFKGEEDPTSVPVEWICWLSGQRKKAPNPEELIELEARRERVRLNVALLKKEEEERKSKEGVRRSVTTGKVGSPDLKSFLQQFPGASFDNRRGNKPEEIAFATDDITNDSSRDSEATDGGHVISPEAEPISSEPSGSGQSFKPGTWQPPT
eukprot:TRINITY_DN4817_c0_g2_i3.p1 TRINITY_DN4817_c0_g2~~TRINITY_DN4817_c0_g2_i3.p1  ORF type:complete len:196 (-),score=42.84 TRINITY_DN4817_c0_g2_i3:408-995(-)